MQQFIAPAPDLPPRHSRRTTAAVVLIAATLWGAFALPAAAQRTQLAPEAATGRANKVLAVARSHMVSAANPLAVEAGLEMLRAGGSAIDAAIAVQLVLNLVEPQSSGLGGGAFLLHWDARTKDLKPYDGRETAPASAQPDRFIREGRPLPFDEAVPSGLSVGVPGVARLLETAHKRHGKLPWPRLFEPALELAEQGFRVSPRLHLLLTQQGAESFAPAARRYFFTEIGAARPVGAVLRNPEFGATLRALRDNGASAFYSGPVADAVVEAVATAPNHPGDMALTDLAGYEVKERPPVCFTYRRHRICGMGPPSSGGLAVAQVLGLLETFDLGRGRKAAMNPRALHLIAEAEKLAFADRDFYVADPDFVPVPPTLLDPGYLAERRTLIKPLATMTRPQPGTPPATLRHALGEDATRESAGTSHFSIVDGQGNAVALTTTIEAAFGSRVWAAGFLLNNQLTDFSFRPRDREGRLAANAVAAGKRPRSSMAPTMVFDQGGRVRAVLGSPGGSRIILYVVKALIALIDWELDAQAAAALLNFGSRGGAFEIEYEPADWQPLIRSRFSTPVIWHALRVKPYGHTIAPEVLTSGLHIIAVRDSGIEGGADPRREGVARGD
jgi:gamma-glutamyltranspeptidase/glutathione hydrolase